MTDLRLVAPALVAWGTSMGVLIGLSSVTDLALRHSLAQQILLLAVFVVVAAVGASLTVSALRARIGVLITVIAGMLAAFAAAAQVSAWTSPGVTQFHGSDVQIVGVVNGPPRESLAATFLPVASSSIHVKGSTESPFSVQVPISMVLPRFFEVPPAGTVVMADGTLGPAKRSLTVAAYLTAADGLTVIGQPGVIDRAAQRVREALHASLPAHPQGGSALVAGLAIGDETPMTSELVDEMRLSGLSHLTAVSGGNVAIVVGAVIGIAWLLRLPMALRVMAALIAIVFYAIVVHPEPSVLRAGVMGAVVVLSLFVGGRRPGPSVLSVAVLVLVVLVPSLSVSWGFALSVAATGGIVMLTPMMREKVKNHPWGSRVPDPIVIAAALTLAAQLATAPVLLAMGAYVGVAAVPANVVAMPVVPLVTIAGLGAGIIGLVPGMKVVADVIAWIGAMAGEWIAQVARIAASVDVLRVRGTVTLAIVAAVLIAALFLLWPLLSGRLNAVLAAGAICVLSAAIWWAWQSLERRSWPPANWVMVQCDVGQGDALVIAPSGNAGAVVVDTGISAKRIDQCLADVRVEHISVLVLTHFHADHVNGITGVFNGRRVDSVISTPALVPEEQAQGVMHELSARGMTMRSVSAGDSFRVGTGEYRVVGPRRMFYSGQVSDGSGANNASVVLDAHIAGLRFLLTGDIEPAAQTSLLGGPGGFDVATVPHHGSAHQHPRFASWVRARVALVSVGADNTFGHPAPEVLADWHRSGARIFRSDHSGDIAVVVDDRGEMAIATRS